MASRALSRGLVALATGGVSLGVLAPAAYADAPVEQGWWTVSNAGAVAAPAPPDVPADGLLVQGGPASPTAMAAVVYELSAGDSADRLVLTVAPDSATTPAATLQLCALTIPALRPQQGGPMADAPAYDCERKTSAAPGDDGTTYTFEVAALAERETLAVAVLPVDAGDRVVLAKPGADSLETSGSTPSSEPPPAFGPSLPPAAEPPPDSGSGSVPGGPPPFDSDTVGPAVAPPAAGTPPVVAPADEGTADTSALGSVVPTSVASRSGSGDRTARGLLALVALVAGVSLWAYAGRRPLADRDEAPTTG